MNDGSCLEHQARQFTAEAPQDAEATQRVENSLDVERVRRAFA